MLDDAEIIRQTVNSIIAKFNKVPLDMAEFQELCEFPFSVLYKNLGLTIDEIEFAQEQGNAFFHDFYEPRASASSLRNGLDQILTLAKQHSVRALILSNHLQEPIQFTLKRFGIENYIFDVLAYSSRTTQYKHVTKGEKLGRYMKSNGIRPDSVIIVGDTPEECHISQHLRLTSVAITGGVVSESRLRHAKPDYVIHSHFELADIMSRHRMLT